MKMLMIDYTRIAWWYWLVTACLLSIGVAGQDAGFLLAMGLTVVQLVHFTVREGSVTAFPIQVRVAYLALLLLCWPQPMRLLYWLPTIGTWAQVLFGYCLMARTVSLLPWNRPDPFTAGLLVRTYAARPVRGSILQGQPPLA
jgi:hypothetical protein